MYVASISTRVWKYDIRDGHNKRDLLSGTESGQIAKRETGEAASPAI